MYWYCRGHLAFVHDGDFFFFIPLVWYIFSVRRVVFYFHLIIFVDSDRLFCPPEKRRRRPFSSVDDRSTIMSLEDRGVVAIWEGEWLWLRRQLSTVRQTVWMFGALLGPVFDLAAYLATAKVCVARADRFVTEQTLLASEQLRRRHWILPAIGITSASLFVLFKSSPWGTYRAFRNGAVTAALLTCFLLPREIIDAVDAELPFSTRDTRGVEGNARDIGEK
ncbi:hypothetical protein, conserved [Trypanosoma cruzi]|uniref:Uncharacterized protein n=2 Tax=Trypanosoma cruzi TaxID=5693 RepID=Q4DFU2_TRYCC|nr:hypothetical protein, conserved [Trypanosoma cruzi]EAN91398.1 hypothetical protein, conserved [Trypanosoma cruzi]|eukprot:XP_813249.1 hypothetical protein [Trypanosoma cruzi strain CL Brener]